MGRPADIRLQKISGARRRVRDKFGFGFADTFTAINRTAPVVYFRGVIFWHIKWVSSTRTISTKRTTRAQCLAAKVA